MSHAHRQSLPSHVVRIPRAQSKLIAVIPAFNEALNLPTVLAELKALQLDHYAVDYVVVDDGSQDKTSQVAREFGAQVVCLPYNMGIGMTVQTGFRYALAHGAELIVQVDGDGQHIPNEISKLIPSITENKADVVVGTRFSKGQRDGIQSTTFMRWFAGRLLARTVQFLTGQKLSDTTSGFRVFNRKAAEFIAHNYPDDYPEVQVLVSLARRGFRIVEVPVQMRSRVHGKSSINWSRSIYYVFKVMFASFMDRVRKK